MFLKLWNAGCVHCKPLNQNLQFFIILCNSLQFPIRAVSLELKLNNFRKVDWPLYLTTFIITSRALKLGRILLISTWDCAQQDNENNNEKKPLPWDNTQILDFYLLRFPVETCIKSESFWLLLRLNIIEQITYNYVAVFNLQSPHHTWVHEKLPEKHRSHIQMGKLRHQS